MRFLCLLLSFYLILSAQTTCLGEDVFAEMIRKTDPRTPSEQLKTFHLPTGFEIQLVASEPEIGKPMNMSFDGKGRLWICQSREYPFPVLPLDKPGRDALKVLSDFDKSGRAKKITTFADELNLSMGLLPYKNGVIQFSIPNIYYREDLNHDGRSDSKEILLGKFGYEKDTHGLASNFRRGFDGWVYADHGFANESTITAKDGSTVTMSSGNCYRFTPDGSTVEQYSHGQVNPFGLAFDPLGDLWSADCHSSAVYQLLRGAYYPSFGKPHDGLGFGPKICEHSHGSTAIAGIAFYAATNFPPEFRNNTFIGNVMTCRINRDSFIERGSTRIAKEEPDFLTCDDPWFRPVDVQLGPDGALYVADFYNRIIAHVEVPLDHPGRDKERGRIWRIVYTGKIPTQQTATLKAKRRSQPKVQSNSLPENVRDLLAELGSSNLTRRMLALNEIVDGFGANAISSAKKLLEKKSSSAIQKTHLLWVLHRLGGLKESDLISAGTNTDFAVRIHAVRILAEMSDWTLAERNLVLRHLADPNAYVQRAAADALARHPHFQNIQPLLVLRASVDTEDSQLLHTVRMSLRDQLAAQDNFSRVQQNDLSETNSRAIADVATGIKSASAGEFLLNHLRKFPEEREKLTTYLKHAARFAPESEMGNLASFTQAKFPDDLDFQLTLFKSVQEGFNERGAKLPSSLQEWGASLAEQLLVSVDEKTLDWRNSPVKGDAETTNPWFLETRESSDKTREQFISSLSPGGEKLTGILRSKPFAIPERLTFFIAGHSGSPDKPANKKNLFRLRDVGSNQVITNVFPPRNDIAQKVVWDLSKHAGKQGYLEIIDGNAGHGFAWLAVGRFEPAVVPMPKLIPNQVDKRQEFAAELAGSLKILKLEPSLAALLNNAKANDQSRVAAAKALQTLNPDSHINDFAKVFRDDDASIKLREKIAALLGEIDSEPTRDILLQALGTAPKPLQTQIALALAANTNGATALIENAAAQKISSRLLQDRAVKERLLGLKSTNITERVEHLTKNLSPISAQKQKLIDERATAFLSSEASSSHGAEVFKQNCAACHSVDGQGGLVGPQLDGIGARGAERLIEDILDPSRNVDPAFRYTIVTRTDDETITGLLRREEGEIAVFVDATGKEISVPKKEIKERRQSELSLMPDNFNETIKPEDFNDLLAFLLSHTAKQSAAK
jgi:putative heme-binding domain-containing protein